MYQNKVELIGYYGSDIVHAQSAWTSTSRDLTEEKLGRVDKLLKMLAKEGHHTPFEKSCVHFLVTVDQASHIHTLKHRIAVAINGESARYKELKEDKFYLPQDWIGIKNSSEDEDWYTTLLKFTELSNKLYHQCLNELTPVLGRKRAKESARFFKTMNSQITLDVMFNWRSFNHFLKLRNNDHAQKEINEISSSMLELTKNIEGNPFKHTIEAFEL
jgi:flavin-dependent thymidylate synthase